MRFIVLSIVEPLAFNPPRISNADWADGTLTLTSRQHMPPVLDRQTCPAFTSGVFSFETVDCFPPGRLSEPWAAK
jgi:hypothetical protein